MTVLETMQDMRKRYPIISNSPYCILNHLFAVIGTGLEWQHGQLMPADNDNDYRTPYRPDDQKAKRLYNQMVSWDTLSYSGNYYPLSNYSRLNNVPDDVEEDWLIGAIVTTCLIIASKDTVPNHPSYNNKKNAELAQVALGNLLDRFFPGDESADVEVVVEQIDGKDVITQATLNLYDALGRNSPRHIPFLYGAVADPTEYYLRNERVRLSLEKRLKEPYNPEEDEIAKQIIEEILQEEKAK